MVGKVVVVSGMRDLHTDRIVQGLNSRDIPVFRFNTDDYPGYTTVSIDVREGHYKSRIGNGVRSMESGTVGAAFFRRIDPPLALDSVETRYRQFVLSEREESLTALWGTFGDALWVNDPLHDFATSNKLYQLHEAQRLGFKVPDTIVTTSREEAITFFGEKKDVITKGLKNRVLAMGDDGSTEVILTEKVEEEDMKSADGVEICPVLFQETVPKKYELRVTVVEDRVFPAAIYSQEYNPVEKTKLDWRVANYDYLRHEAVKLDDDIEERCKKITEQLGLKAGAIDMIVRPDGEHVFLEINPSGQWLWVEELTRQPITKAYLDLLERGAKDKS